MTAQAGIGGVWIAANGKLPMRVATPEQKRARGPTSPFITSSPKDPPASQAKMEPHTMIGMNGATMRFATTPTIENWRNAMLRRGIVAKLATAEANADCLARNVRYCNAVVTLGVMGGGHMTSALIAANESKKPMSKTAVGMQIRVIIALAAVEESPSASCLVR